MEEKFNKEALLEEIKTLIGEANKGAVTEKQLEAKIGEINKTLETLNSKEDNHEEVKDLKNQVEQLVKSLNDTTAALKEQGETLKAIKENGKTKDKPATFRDAIKNAFLEKKDTLMKEVNDDYGKRLSMKEFIESGAPSPKMTIKTAVDMLESNISGNYVDYLRLTELDPNRVGIPLAVYPHVMDWMQQKNIMKPYMALLVVGTYTDGSGTKTEGSASSKSSFLLTTKSFPAFYLATYFTISDETFDDLEEVLDEISITAPDKILSKIDSKIISASGDDSTDIAGLYTANKHTAFTASTYAGSVAGANIIDLVGKMKLTCLSNGYTPNVVIFNPADIDNLAAYKDANDNSISDRRVRWDNMGNPVMINGMRIITSDKQTANTVAVLDFAQPWIGKRKDMTMEIGYNGTDLTEGQKTVIIKVRVAFGVRDKAGVIYSSDLATDIATIKAV